MAGKGYFLVPAEGLKPCTFSAELKCCVKSKIWYPSSYGKTNAQRKPYIDSIDYPATSCGLPNYRYHVLKGDIQRRWRELVIQICDVEEVDILKGVVSKDHVHIHIEYPLCISISQLVKRMKGRTSRLLQKEFPKLKKRYCGRHIWTPGYEAWSTCNITDEMVQEYLEHYRSKEVMTTQILFWNRTLVRS